MTNLHYSTATQLAAALRAMQVSAVELVNRSIARIESFDKPINAVIARDFDKARADAVLADKGLAAGDRRPLLPSYWVKPMCRCSWPITKVITTSTAPPTIRGTLRALRGARLAVRPPHWPPAMCHWNWAPISGAPCVCPLCSAASMRTVRVFCHRAATRLRVYRQAQMMSIWQWWDLWHAQQPI